MKQTSSPNTLRVTNDNSGMT